MKKILAVFTLLIAIQFNDSDIIKDIELSCDGNNCNVSRNFQDL